ncbi:fimbrial protein [Salmonella enterica subsp. enterica serovar Dortmund]|nr:fimbrial protein [Salmonella enterica subsp. enterica serovar Dortmund]ECA8970268.1 fimbrial protein [Salmonella enterica subsp. enterica serovar Omuna]ECI3849781.1 fimbrial protein [Salmonella enterica subsp. enterica]EDS6039672.1 fimbrial protein [Salmonella enterica subsp. enterica serovar Lexington]EEJ7235818.1 fimbrial protein [Salmonella enterica subsp. salamae]
MKINIISSMFLAAVATGACVVSPVYADGTPSVGLTVNSIVTSGTCAATMDTGASSGTTKVVDFGSVPISQIAAMTKVAQFKIQFSSCSGVQSAQVELAPRNIGCSGDNSNLAAFANASSATPKAARTAVEVWTTDTPAGSGAVQLHCYNKNTQTVDLSSVTSTTTYDYPLSARLRVVEGRQQSEVTPGDFYSPTTFTISYQ